MQGICTHCLGVRGFIQNQSFFAGLILEVYKAPPVYACCDTLHLRTARNLHNATPLVLSFLPHAFGAREHFARKVHSHSPFDFSGTTGWTLVVYRRCTGMCAELAFHKQPHLRSLLSSICIAASRCESSMKRCREPDFTHERVLGVF